MKKIVLYSLLALLIACKPKVDEFEYSAGDANFTTYVAIGNSLTAGYSNGALYKSGQENSYPNILSKQFAKVGGGSFNQPYLESETGVGFVAISPSVTLLFQKRSLGHPTDCKGITSLGPLAPVTASPTVLAPPVNAGPYNNLGVPGAKSIHLTASAFGNPSGGNPFYARFATAPGTSTIIGDAMAQNPTFFTLWIGSNDVLLYAVGGGDQAKDITASDTLTPPAIFSLAMSSIVNTLTAGGAKGAIANIPDITTIPYFTTVPYNGLTLDATQASQLTAAYNGTGITFSEGANAFIIEDLSVPVLNFRKIKSTEYVLLSVPQDSLKCKGWGSQKPIPARYVLDESEINKIVSYTSQYNNTIHSLADSKGLAMVNANIMMSSLQSGFAFDGIHFTNKYVTGGAFSLDGIHLTPRGYAVVANEFIRTINSKFNASIPEVNVTDYKGLDFP